MKEIYIVVTNTYGGYGCELYAVYASESYDKCKKFVDENKAYLDSTIREWELKDKFNPTEYDTFIRKVILDSENKTYLGGYKE